MLTELNQKNEFVVDLRESLKSKYKTRQDYTYGEEAFEGRRVGNGYIFFPRDPNKPKDLRGFCFRKDLCSWAPQSGVDVLKDVYEFSLKDKTLESLLGEDGKTLTMKFGDDKYLVISSVDGGYAGEISVYFFRSLSLSEKVT